MSVSSLSAASTASPFTSIRPFGFWLGGIRNGPCHEWPQSVERWTIRLCTMPGTELLERDRRVDERATRHVLDVGIAKDLRKQLPEDDVITRRRQLAAVHERLPAVIGVHEARDGCRRARRIDQKATEVVEADDDMLAGGIDGNARFRLQRADDDDVFVFTIGLVDATARLTGRLT